MGESSVSRDETASIARDFLSFARYKLLLLENTSYSLLKKSHHQLPEYLRKSLINTLILLKIQYRHPGSTFGRRKGRADNIRRAVAFRVSDLKATMSAKKILVSDTLISVNIQPARK